MMDLDIYGVPNLKKGAEIDCPWRWPGQYADIELETYQNRYRYYSPYEGRFISQDPLRFYGGLRYYSYPANPMTAFDPFGLMPWRWNSDSGMGHHLVLRNKANSAGLPSLGTPRDTPTFFPTPYTPGDHELIHRVQRPHIGPLQGPWSGTADELLEASKKGLDTIPDLRGYLRIPSTGEVVAKNVTPTEAFDELMDWHKKQTEPESKPCT